MIWHSSSKEEVLKHYNVDATVGLANGEVVEKQEIYGKNVVLTTEKPSIIKAFFAA